MHWLAVRASTQNRSLRSSNIDLNPDVPDHSPRHCSSMQREVGAPTHPAPFAIITRPAEVVELADTPSCFPAVAKIPNLLKTLDLRFVSSSYLK